MKMKKCLGVLLSFCMLANLAACSPQQEPAGSPPPDAASQSASSSSAGSDEEPENVSPASAPTPNNEAGALSPEDTVRAYLDSIMKLDTEQANQYLENPSELADNDDTVEEEVYSKALVEGLQYQVLSCDETGETAIVKTEITNLDMAVVFVEALQQAFAAAFDGTSSEDTEDVMTEQMLQSMKNHKGETVTNTVEVHLKKVDGVWKIQADDELANALTGNLAKVATEMGMMQQDTADSSAD